MKREPRTDPWIIATSISGRKRKPKRMVKKSQQRGRKRTRDLGQWGLKRRSLDKGYVVHEAEKPHRNTWRRSPSFDPLWVSSLWNEREGITPLATRLGEACSEPLLQAEMGTKQNRVHRAMNGGKRGIHRLVQPGMFPPVGRGLNFQSLTEGLGLGKQSL